MDNHNDRSFPDHVSNLDRMRLAKCKAKTALVYNAPVTLKEANADWDKYIRENPGAHILQTSTWGQLKSSFEWDYATSISGGSGAQVLFRRFPLGYSLAYVPKGPLGGWSAALIEDLDRRCREHNAFVLKVEPDADWSTEGADELRGLGFVSSPQTIQPQRTIIVDIRDDDEIILSRMKQKTRYNIRLAARKGVMVRAWGDVPSFSKMMVETATRDHFGAHSEAYFQRAYDLFHPSGACELLAAEVEGDPVAAIMVFRHGPRAWYFYGASTSKARERMPTYLLQWEAMRWARDHGCLEYDLWGIPDEDEATLEEQFTHRRDGLWGVYRFKRGFGGRVVRSIGAWDRPYRQHLYRAYAFVFNRHNRS